MSDKSFHSILSFTAGKASSILAGMSSADLAAAYEELGGVEPLRRLVRSGRYERRVISTLVGRILFDLPRNFSLDEFIALIEAVAKGATAPSGRSSAKKKGASKKPLKSSAKKAAKKKGSKVVAKEATPDDGWRGSKKAAKKKSKVVAKAGAPEDWSGPIKRHLANAGIVES